jgi:hypothetical protein
VRCVLSAGRFQLQENEIEKERTKQKFKSRLEKAKKCFELALKKREAELEVRLVSNLRLDGGKGRQIMSFMSYCDYIKVFQPVNPTHGQYLNKVTSPCLFHG